MSDVTSLIAEFDHLRSTDFEPTLLNIGGRGYYENPMSDILAFFLDPRERHGLGDLVLASLLQLLDCRPEDGWQPELVEPPSREVRGVDSSSRTDIVLHGADWVVVLENKIRHWAANPFPKYEKDVTDRYPHEAAAKRIKFCILSPRNENIDNWRWVATSAFLRKVDKNLRCRSRECSGSKWSTLLRDFVVTVQQEVSREMDQDTFNQLSEGYAKIVRVQKLHRAYIEEFKRRMADRVAGITSEPYPVREHTWPEHGKALRVYPHADNQNVTLLIFDEPAAPNQRFRVQYYISAGRKIGLADGFAVLGTERGMNLYYRDFGSVDDALGGVETALRTVVG